MTTTESVLIISIMAAAAIFLTSLLRRLRRLSKQDMAVLELWAFKTDLCQLCLDASKDTSTLIFTFEGQIIQEELTTKQHPFEVADKIHNYYYMRLSTEGRRVALAALTTKLAAPRTPLTSIVLDALSANAKSDLRSAPVPQKHS